jgi:hypothetical protein
LISARDWDRCHSNQHQLTLAGALSSNNISSLNAKNYPSLSWGSNNIQQHHRQAKWCFRQSPVDTLVEKFCCMRTSIHAISTALVEVVKRRNSSTIVVSLGEST